MPLERHLAIPLRRSVQSFGLVVLEGPRGAGKTTLLRKEFADSLYVSLDDTVDRQRAREDPEQFLMRLRRAAVIDEVQRAPELVAYLRRVKLELPLVFVSSVRLGLPLERLELHGPTLAERQRRHPLKLEMIGRFVPAREKQKDEEAGWGQNAGWPEADLRALVPVRDLDRLIAFAEKVKASSGTGLQQQELARQAGVSHRTAVRWLEALEACFLTVKLEPIEEEFGRRMVKRPKLHFLMGSGNFESEVVSEIYRNACHSGVEVRLGYWRDSNGLEIPLVIGRIGVGIAEMLTPAVEGALQRWMRISKSGQVAMITRELPRLERRELRVLRYEARQL